MKTLRKLISTLLILALFVPHAALFAQTNVSETSVESSPTISLSSSEPKNTDDNTPQISSDSGVSVVENKTGENGQESSGDEKASVTQTINNSQTTLIPGTRTPELTYKQNIDSKVDTFSGALTQSVPIQIPNGRNNFQPNISLDYNSQNQDTYSQVGFSWSLSVPSIERVNKTGIEKLYIDNYFNSSLSGELASTTNASVFKTKNENGDFLKYSFVANVWTVTDKKGMTYVFGKTDTSRQFSASSTASTTKWMLSEVRDSNNNFYRYEYVKDGNEIYPSKIFYTGSGTQDGLYSVEFSLENRPDTYINYKNGYKVEIKKRIKEISIKAEGNERGKYVLGYTSGTNNTRSLLASVTESRISESGIVTIMPATTFQYANDPVTYVKRDENANSATRDGYFQSGRVPIDFDGNGLNEKLGSYSLEVGHGYLMGNMSNQGLNMGTYVRSFNTVVQAPWTTGPNGFPEEFLDYGTRVFDVNGDLLPDLVRAGQPRLEETSIPGLFFNTGNLNFATTTSGQIPTYRFYEYTGAAYSRTSAALLVNSNGDHLVDTYSDSTQCILTALPGPTQHHCSLPGAYIGNGNGWDMNPKNLFSHQLVYGSPISGDLIFSDVNGDGLDDQIKQRDASTTVVYLNTGNNTWSATPSTWTIPQPLQEVGTWLKYDQGVRVLDVNGDGLIDILRSYNVNIPSNTSNMTVNSTGTYMPFPAQGNYKIVYLNTGSGWVENTNISVFGIIDNVEIINYNWRGKFLINDSYFDANGDGLIDFGNNIRQGRKPDMLVKTTYGTGATIDVEYKPTPQHVKPRVGNPGFFDQTHPKLPSVIYTVTKLTKNTVGQPSQITEYLYEGGKNDFRGPNTLKFAGFKKVTQTTNNTKTTSYFHQGDDSDATVGEQGDEFAKIGKVFREDITDTAGNVFKRNWYTWNAVDRGNDSWFTYMSNTVEQTYDGTTSHRDIATTYAYDTTNGNLLTTTDWGEVQGGTTAAFTDVGSDKRITTIAYAANASQTQFAPKEISKVDASGALIEKTKLYYDNLAHGTLTKGNQTKQESFKDASSFVTTTKSYNTSGLVTSEQDANGNTTTYTYDSYNLFPKTITNARSQDTTYVYDYGVGKPIRITNGDGNTSTYTYDGLGRMLEEWIPNKGGDTMLKSTFEYVDIPTAISVKKSDYLDDSTSVDTYTYFDGLNRPVQTKREAENGNWVTIDTMYDNQGRVFKQSLPYFTQTNVKSSPTGNNNLFTTFVYDPLDRVTQQTNAVGTTRFEYAGSKKTVTDPLNRSMYYYTDAFGNLSKVTESTGLIEYNTLYEYNGQNKLTKMTDANSNVRHFTYDLLGRQLTAEDIHAPSDTHFGVYAYVYDAAGNVIQKTTPSGMDVVYTYDALNRIVTEDPPTKQQGKTLYTYDSCDNGMGKLCEVRKVAIQPASLCDMFNCANALLPVMTKKMQYTGAGLVSQEVMTVADETYTTHYFYDHQGNVMSSTNPDQSITTNTYNEAGLLESVSYYKDNALQTVISNIDYAPTGLPTLQVNGNGTQTCSTYDTNKLYRLTSKKTVGIGGTCAGNTQATQGEQGVEGTPESLEQKISRLVQEGKAVVNELGETRLVTPELIEETLEYSKMLVGYDNRQEEIYALEITAKKLESIQNPEVVESPGVASSFNEQSQGISIFGYATSFAQARNYPHGIIEGSLATTGVQNGAYKISRYFFSFDTSILPDNAVTTIARIRMYSRPYNINVGYVGIVEGKQVSGTTITYTDYSKCGNALDNPVIGGQKNISDIGYNQYNNFDLNQNGLAWINPTGYSKFCIRVSADIENSFNSDTQNNIGASFHHEGDPARKHSILIEYVIPGTNILYNLENTVVSNLPHPLPTQHIHTNSYVYDAVGNITSITNSRGTSTPQTYTYTYDALNRLLSKTGSETESFTYDPLGNILTRNSVPYLYETPSKTNPHAVTKIGAIPLTYDAQGNVLTIGEATNPTTNVWNYRNELVSTNKGGNSVTYLYDHQGQRIQKTTNSITSLYPTPYFSQTNTGTSTTFIMTGNENVATITNSGVLWNHTDHLGSTIATTNQTGSVVETTEYSSFGDQVKRSTYNNTEQTEKYTGHTYDPETDLLYAQARYYRGSLGRFLSQDPLHWTTPKEYLVDPQQQNSYSYARNNPLKFVDTTGKYVESVIDLGFIAYDLAEIGYYKATGNTQAAKESSAYLGLDLAGLATPGATGLGIAGRVGKATEKVVNVAKAGEMKSVTNLTDDMFVCRGGSCGVNEFIGGTGVKQDHKGILTGVSVNVGKNESLLVNKLPNRFNGEYGILSKSLIEKSGGTIISSPTKNNPFHSVINGLTGQQLNKLFAPTVKSTEAVKNKK